MRQIRRYYSIYRRTDRERHALRLAINAARLTPPERDYILGENAIKYLTQGGTKTSSLKRWQIIDARQRARHRSGTPNLVCPGSRHFVKKRPGRTSHPCVKYWRGAKSLPKEGESYMYVDVPDSPTS